MTENTTPNFTVLLSAISGSTIIHVMDHELIFCTLYDFSGARTLDSLETMQDYFRHFRGLRRKNLEGLHVVLCRVLGELSSGVGTESRG